jgi:hypothetical protein
VRIPHNEEVRVTAFNINGDDVVVNFSDTLREKFYVAFEKQIRQICEDLKIIFFWREAYDSVRIHLPRSVLQDIRCVLKNFLKKFTFAHAP